MSKRAAGAVAAMALAVAGIALVPSVLGPVALSPAAGGAGSQDPVACPTTGSCSASPAEDAAGGAVITYVVGSTVDDAQDDQRERCFALPGVTGTLVQLSIPVSYRVTVLAEQAAALERCLSTVPGVRALGPEPPATVPATAGAVAWEGARVCVVAATAEAEPCRRLDAGQAAALDAVLSRVVPPPPGQAYCEALRASYSIVLEYPSVKPVPVVVPDRCGPVDRDGVAYLLDQAGRDAVRRAYETGVPSD